MRYASGGGKTESGFALRTFLSRRSFVAAIPTPMSCRSFVCLALTLSLAGCAAEKEKQKKKDAAEIKQEQSQKVAEDPAFLAFLGRLRIAVANKDHATLTSMMTADFGYRWDTPPVGDDVFCDDPTVNRLQEMAAARLGHEAGLFIQIGRAHV